MELIDITGKSLLSIAEEEGVVKLALVVEDEMYPRVGLKTLTLPSWMNFDEKIEPMDILTSIGMIYRY
jgi:hypothetical protein